ncbi:hypothetical protein LG651_12405 [Tamlana sp. 62-3]|uniref:Uncharacterized protein n=1 Tax=Neotamlana sargassicola TaxID=2883125 RepID=A0A9X1I876_9FLAO|nr:hypothetical protein [Tamlana sargassicola]
MLQTRHCNLCEHSKRSLKHGITCRLTNKKPDFIEFCPNIKFTEAFNDSYKSLNSNIKIARKGNIVAYIKFVLLIIIGLFVILKSYYLLIEANTRDYSRSGYHYFKLAILVLFLGSAFVKLAFISLSNYTKPLRELKFEKKEIDIILRKYNKYNSTKL